MTGVGWWFILTLMDANTITFYRDDKSASAASVRVNSGNYGTLYPGQVYIAYRSSDGRVEMCDWITPDQARELAAALNDHAMGVELR